MTVPARRAEELTKSDLLIVWQVLSDRRAAYDAMMWQTPALGMTAQAFLLTLSLGSGSSSAARIASAALSALISLMVVQLLAKHRRNEFLDSLCLETLESDLRFDRDVGFRPHSKNRYSPEQIQLARDSAWTVLCGPDSFWDMSSFKVWCYGQYLFMVAALGIILVVLIGQERIFTTL